MQFHQIKKPLTNPMKSLMGAGSSLFVKLQIVALNVRLCRCNGYTEVPTLFIWPTIAEAIKGPNETYGSLNIR